MRKLFIALFLFVPTLAFAHQPRIVALSPTVIVDPEVSKAYYGELTGEPAVYTIHADKPFDLYVGALVPDIAGQKKDVSAVVLKSGVQVVALEGSTAEWKKIYEPFGADAYWSGPEFRARAVAGDYEIRVWSSNNDSRYALVVGETEVFDWKETVNVLTVVPELKRTFFNESPATFLLSPIGASYVGTLFVLAFLVGFVFRSLLRRFAQQPRSLARNIGTRDRILRISIGFALLLFAILTTWNPLLLFLAGFCFFEAIFGWCGFYAVLGKDTCIS